MHHDEVDIDEELVRRLLSASCPQWEHLAITPVDSTGTVNAVFRLGDEMMVRLPRTPRWHGLDTECCWLSALAPLVPVAIPQVLVRGEPGCGYPWPWAVFTWIDGRPWAPEANGASPGPADDVVRFLGALHGLDPADQPCPAPPTLPSLAASDASVRSALADARGMLDTGAVRRAWEQALRLPEWSGEPVLLHGDLLAGNVLVRRGRLHAVIDWAGVRVGDPARDLVAAWTLLRGAARHRFRAAMAVDEATWARAHGWALTRITNVAYYATTNRRFSSDAVATIVEALADPPRPG